MPSKDPLGNLYITSLASTNVHEFVVPSKDELYDKYNELILRRNQKTLAAELPLEGSDMIQANEKASSNTDQFQDLLVVEKATRSWLAHESTLWQCLYVPSSKTLMTCSRDARVKQWDLCKNTTTPQQLHVSQKYEEEAFGDAPQLMRTFPRAQKHWITCMELIDQPENSVQMLACGSDDKTVQIYRLDDYSRPFEGKLEIKCKSGVYALKSVDRGRKLVAGTHRGECFMYDLVKGEQTLKWKAHEDQVTAFELHNNMLVSSAQYDEKIHIWDLRVDNSVKPIGVMAGHTAPVWALKQHGNSLFSAGSDGSICKWQWHHYQQYECKFPKMHNGQVVYQLQPVDKNIMASAGDDLCVRLWDTRHGVQIAKVETGVNVHSMQFA
mmetsp:Transcript_11644/g.43777  ORF Transcript_11644/g.43777 Transcript_11644/m.43777 type:complete len:382 (-) Transcript_11644:164-1309(-)